MSELVVFVGVDAELAQTQAGQFRVQAFLSDLMQVVCAHGALLGDAESAWSQVPSTPVPGLGHRSLLQVVAEGRAEDALTYIGAISTGFVG